MATQSQSTSDQPEAARTSEETQASTLESDVGAAFIASGIGSVALGLTVIGAEGNANIRSALTFTPAVGPLSGKTIVTVIAFVVSWIILHYVLRERNMRLGTSFALTLVLLAIGLLLTFPPVFLLFGG